MVFRISRYLYALTLMVGPYNDQNAKQAIRFVPTFSTFIIFIPSSTHRNKLYARVLLISVKYDLRQLKRARLSVGGDHPYF